MSFILDALRRADAERERGQVPGLNSQAEALPPVSAAPAPARRRDVPVLAWLLSGAGAGLVLAAGAGWWWSARQTGSTAPEPPSQVAIAPDTASPVPAPAAATEAAAASPGLPPAPVARAEPDAAAAPKPVRPAPPAVREPVAAPPAGRASGGPQAVARTPAARPPSDGSTADRAGPPAAPPVTTRPKAQPPAPAEALARSTEGPLPLMSAADRQRLPKLQIGGAMYSEERSSRMLVVNDQLLREGDRAAPGVTLVRIGPRSARFVFEGQAVELPY